MAIGLSLLNAPEAASAFSLNGSQFQVNTYTTDHQRSPAVASDSAGNFVVVWGNWDRGPNSYSSHPKSIHGQRFAASGAAIGGQFQVNTSTTYGRGNPAVASDSAGDFVVVWESHLGEAADYTVYNAVQGQRYEASGAPVGGEFQVNTYTTGLFNYPSVASDPAGNFVVVWNHGGIRGRRYDSAGNPVGGEFQVDTYGGYGGAKRPSVASDTAGNFVVVWDSWGSPGTDTGYSYSVQARRYDASGSAVGAQFQVNSYTTGHQRIPSVATDSTGRFVVVWGSGEGIGVGSHYSIRGQRYSTAGIPIGGEIQVKSDTTDILAFPAVAGDASGDWVVIWRVGAGFSPLSIHGQTYDASGSPSGGEFLVNTYTTGPRMFNDGFLPSVASDSAGKNFVVVWDGNESPGSDTSGYSIQAQRYLPEPSLVQSVCAVLAIMLVFARRRQV